MEKILNGVVRFHENMANEMRPSFFKLVQDGQNPRALFITCADSRIIPNLVTDTEPGDLFVIRNIGNLIPSYTDILAGGADTSVAAAVDYSITVLGIKNIIVCGHSDCGAMKAILKIANKTQVLPDEAPLKHWLRHVEQSVEQYQCAPVLEGEEHKPHDQLAQINAIIQMNRLRAYPEVQKRLETGEINIHALYLSIENAEVQVFHPGRNRFVRIDPQTIEEVMFLRQLFQQSPQIEQQLQHADFEAAC